ncbi:MAG TPA: hypothetical protein VF649_08045 [Sphingomonas sp.]|jgi:hypothetical protein
MATNLIGPGGDSQDRVVTENYTVPKALLCSGLLSATAWGAIACLVILLH